MGPDASHNLPIDPPPLPRALGDTAFSHLLGGLCPMSPHTRGCQAMAPSLRQGVHLIQPHVPSAQHRPGPQALVPWEVEGVFRSAGHFGQHGMQPAPGQESRSGMPRQRTVLIWVVSGSGWALPGSVTQPGQLRKGDIT